VAGSCKCVNESSGSMKCGESPNIAALLMTISGLYISRFIFVAQQPLVCLALLSIDTARSYSDTLHSV
jgi:hypothetical protein